MGSVSSISRRWTRRPSGPVWWVIERHAENLARELTGFLGVLRDFDAAAFTASAGVDLRFDDHAAAEAFGDASASWAEKATSPRGTGTLYLARMALA